MIINKLKKYIFIQNLNEEIKKNIKKLSNVRIIINNIDFNENLSKCPITYKILNKFRDKINLSGFSYLKGNTILEEHNDYTGITNNSLAFHMGLIIPKTNNSCKLVLYNDKVNRYYYKEEKEGEIIIADTNYKHYAYNQSNEDRVILYVDFGIS